MLRTLPLSILLLLVSFGTFAQSPFFVPDSILTINVDSLLPNNNTGYYFIAPWELYPAMKNSGYAVILDKDYNVCFFKAFKNPNTAGFHGELTDFTLHPNGMMSYFWDDSVSSGYFILDSTFNIVDTLNCINHSTDPHDLKIQPDGSFYILCSDQRTIDLSHDTGFGTWTMSTATDVQATGGVIQHISRNKQLLFEWNAFNYCRPNEVKSGYISNNARIDWTHGNSIFVADDGNLIYSIRNFDQILKISRRDSSVIWRLGGKRSDFTFPGDYRFCRTTFCLFFR